MKILFLSRWLPYPPSNGSKLRIFNLVQGLAKNHSIYLISFAAPEEIGPVAPELTGLCEETWIVPWTGFNPNSSVARQGFLSATPRSILDTYSPELGEVLQQTLRSTKIDLVIASQIDMAAYSRFFRGTPAIFEEAELGVMYEKFSQAASLKNKVRFGLTWAKYRRYIRSLLQDYNAVTVVSEREKEIFSETIGSDVSLQVVPNCVDVDSYRSIQVDPLPGTMVFTGSLRFAPNHEGMKWFIGEVLPIIQEAIPEAALYITGDHGDLPLPPGKNVIRTGLLPDIRTQVAGSWLSVVPIWEGGGTRLKILESMALKTPVVATTKGAEGISAKSGQEIMIADQPETFAAHCISILRDEDLRSKLGTQAFRLVDSTYNWKTTIPRYEKIITAAVEPAAEPDPESLAITSDI